MEPDPPTNTTSTSGKSDPSRRRSARLHEARSSSSSSIGRPPPRAKGGRRGGAASSSSSSAPSPVAVTAVVPAPPPPRYDASIVNAANVPNWPRVIELHEEGISLDSRDEIGWTVLMWATLDGNEATVDYCLDHQCNVDLQEGIGATALHWAANYGTLSVVRKLMITGGADDTLTNDNGETALQRAILYNHHELVNAWESIKSEAKAAREERARQDLEDRMLLALHGCVVTAGEIVPDDGEYPVRILHQKYPEMMIQVMDLFMGVKAVIDA